MNSGYVLVIMPEASQRRRVCALLAATGQVVKEFGIRPEALAAVRLHAPDIVVLDLVLTDADAFALAAELREAAGDAELPILAVCGAFGRPTAARMQEARLLGPILKPVSANMLLRTFLDARDSGSVSPTWISRTARETGPAARDRVSQALLGVSDLAARAHQGPDGLAASIRPCLDLCGCAGASVFTCQPGARLELVTRCGAPELADAVVVASYDSPGFFDRVTRATEPVRIDHDAPGDPLAQAFSTAGRGQVTVLMPIGEPGAGRGLLALTANLDPGERGDLVDLARGLGPVLGLMLELDRQRVGAAVLAAGLAQQQTSALLEAGIAHDLRNVLTVIVGNTGLLLDESKPGTPGHEDLIAIREAASHASLLARRLTSPGGSAGQPGIVPVAGVLADSERLLQRVLGSDIALTLGGLTS
ncbi:MAG TPA: response regulator, partial [Planctomycetota bacterium]|nr:response regulator [Planctomycetota bacterium]